MVTPGHVPLAGRLMPYNVQQSRVDTNGADGIYCFPPHHLCGQWYTCACRIATGVLCHFFNLKGMTLKGDFSYH